MSAPELPFEHAIDIPKGWFHMAALDYTAKVASTVTTPFPAGRVIHLNAQGEFVLGVHNTGMPMIAMTASNALEVTSEKYTADGNFVQQTAIPAGVVTGLVCKGGYEVQSTEFNKQRTYTPGDLLTATATGVLTNAGTGSSGNVKQFVDPVCGVVAAGVLTNHHGVQVLDFWPEWLPGAYPTSP